MNEIHLSVEGMVDVWAVLKGTPDGRALVQIQRANCPTTPPNTQKASGPLPTTETTLLEYDLPATTDPLYPRYIVDAIQYVKNSNPPTTGTLETRNYWFLDGVWIPDSKIETSALIGENQIGACYRSFGPHTNRATFCVFQRTLVVVGATKRRVTVIEVLSTPDNAGAITIAAFPQP